MRLVPCPRCRKPPTVAHRYGYVVYCDGCYDPTPVHSESRAASCEVGIGLRLEAAVSSWNHQAENYEP